jgi:hypothetical protein
LPKERHAQVHHDQAGHAARRVHHHEQEHQAQVQQPGLGQLRQQDRGEHQQHRADDRAEEEDGAAQEGEQQVAARSGCPDRLSSALTISKLIAASPPPMPAKKPATMKAK